MYQPFRGKHEHSVSSPELLVKVLPMISLTTSQPSSRQPNVCAPLRVAILVN